MNVMTKVISVNIFVQIQMEVTLASVRKDIFCLKMDIPVKVLKLGLG